MFDRNREHFCFIIGPMRDADLGADARLQKLKREVVEPIFREIEQQDGVRYTVNTPYSVGMGSTQIMRDVIYHIDRADIVIADLTGSNPNVFYELGITHALGRPCITVLEESQQHIEFDISAYKVFKVNLDEGEFAAARDELRAALRQAARDADWAKFENPVIDFYRAPITYISPAYSLAQGYYHNFVRPVVEAMITRKGRRYFYDIGVETEQFRSPNKIEDAETLTDERRDRLKLQIIVPDQIAYAKRIHADRFRDNIPGAVIEGDGRTYTCFIRTSGDGTMTLIDLPTTIRVMEDAVRRRLRFTDAYDESPEFRAIERQEIDRFILNLELMLKRHENYAAFRDRVEITRYNPDVPANDLLWLHSIMQG